MRVALLHDYLIRFGGAERVLKALAEIFPEAPIYTLLSDVEITKTYFPKSEIRGSFLEKLPRFLTRRHRLLAPWFPVSVETIDLRDFDLVISSSSAFIKGVIVRPRTLHVSYIHAPSRFLWDWSSEYLSDFGWASKIFARFLVHYLRVWDRKAAERPDILIANSRATRDKIWKYYRRTAEVVYPPVARASSDTHRALSVYPAKDFFLIVSYLAPYKRIDLAIEAFNRLGLPLIIIGEGPARKKLEQRAKSNITFLGWQSDEVVHTYYAASRALVFPGEDDFGLTPVEAMSYGKPVLCYRSGGVSETVREGVTGEFFDDPVPEILADGVRRLQTNYPSYNPDVIRTHAKQYSEEHFRSALRALLERAGVRDAFPLGLERKREL